MSNKPQHKVRLPPPAAAAFVGLGDAPGNTPVVLPPPTPTPETPKPMASQISPAPLPPEEPQAPVSTPPVSMLAVPQAKSQEQVDSPADLRGVPQVGPAPEVVPPLPVLRDLPVHLPTGRHAESATHPLQGQPTPKRRVETRKDGRELRKQTIYLPKELYTRLRVYSATHETDMSELTVAALEAFLSSKVP